MAQGVASSALHEISFTGVRQPGCHGLLSFRPVVLRPRFSAGLPFRSVVLSNIVWLFKKSTMFSCSILYVRIFLQSSIPFIPNQNSFWFLLKYIPNSIYDELVKSPI